MSDTTADVNGTNTEGGGNTGDEFKPITSQDDLNRVIAERVTRERAKFKDYADLKAKAEKLTQLEAANQTEAEKAQARVAELEAQLGKVTVESTRLRIAAENGITDSDDIELFLTGTDEETLTKQAKRLAERDANRKKNGNHVSSEGTNNQTASDDRAFAQQLFGG